MDFVAKFFEFVRSLPPVRMMGEWLVGDHIVAASSVAPDIDGLIAFVAIVSGFFFFLAEFAFFALMFKFRAKPGVRAQYLTGDEHHVKRWIAIPHNVILCCDVLIVMFAINVWYTIKQDLPTNPDATISIIGQQWAWQFTHPGLDSKLGTEDDIEDATELHVEVNKTYVFELESLDVLHDFSVAAFRIKQDAIPGRVIKGWFKPTLAGAYDIQCAEMCGVGHGLMGARVFVETPEEHAAWIAANSDSTAVAMRTH